MDTDTIEITIEKAREILHFDKEVEQLIMEFAETPEGEKKLRVIHGLMRNFKKYGAAYCPCKNERISINICPCREHITTGACKCGLYE